MKRGALFLIIGAVLLGGLFLALRPKPGAVPAPPPAPLPGVAPLAAPAAAPLLAPAAKRFELTVTDGKLASGPEVLQANEGDAVTLRVTSNRAAELHLHGYDLELQLKAGVPGELNFTASRSGRFEYELHGQHGAHADLGALEVQPK